MDLMEGTVILDRYLIVAPPPLASLPGMALAHDDRLGRLVSLMVAPAPIGTSRGDRFKRRADVVSLLQHPALPVALDMGIHDGHVVLVYPLTDGRLLADLSAEEAGHRSPRRAMRVVADLAGALGLAHAQGICHGSFSVRSTALEQSGAVTLLDLVWPPSWTALDRADVAPEVQRGDEPDPRADVFALGRMLDRLLLVAERAGGEEEDGAAWDIVRRATAVSSRERYADGAALSLAITDRLAGSGSPRLTIVPSPARAVPRTRPRVAPAPSPGRPVAQRRQRALLSAMALGLALGLAPVADAVLRDAPRSGPVRVFIPGAEAGGWQFGWPPPHGWHPWGPDRGWAPWGGDHRADGSWWPAGDSGDP